MKSVVRLIAAMVILLGSSLSFAGKHPVPLEKNTDPRSVLSATKISPRAKSSIRRSRWGVQAVTKSELIKM